ncbi:hypothetical protein NC652_008518 [Populus alba x Populus x berolinensis]|nr:hypothetical protein NC652_008518 [Populus alba x Populus x berolinensis]
MLVAKMTQDKRNLTGISDSGEHISIFKKNKKLLLVILASLLLVTTVIAIVTGVNSHRNSKNEGTHAILKSSCSSTLYPELCYSAVATVPGATSNLASQKDVIELSINLTIKAVQHNFFTVEKLVATKKLTKREKTALHDCLEIIDETLDELHEALVDLNEYPNNKSLKKHADDLKTLLSSAITNQETCLDGFSHDEADKKVRKALLKGQAHVEKMCSNVLAMIKNMTDTDVANELKTTNRKLMQEQEGNESEWPEWMSVADRRLLQSSSVTPDVVVAADGSGNYKTVSAAVAAAPKKSSKRYIIRIKAGVYRENVDVPKDKTNIMFLGDGRKTTIITASRNVVDGSTTFNSATVAAVGQGFLARGVTFQNTAGPSKHQAVALRVGSDLSAFYDCDMLAYQDTLYVHSNRQFFINCLVAGTVDFIFGNAAVVLQDCDIHARRPNSGQKNMVTAQGRTDPNQNTGIVIQKSRIGATSDLQPVKSSFPTYLGRPWKEYSRTVIMQSSITDVIQPAGWFEWSGSFALNTLYYAEYQNSGAGAGTSRRVTWKGYRVITSATEAQRFTPGNFIAGRYGKVDEAEQQAFRKKSRKRLIIIVVSSIVLLAVIIGAVIGVVVHKRNNKSSSDPVPPPELTPATSLKAVCSVTQYPASCFSSISALEMGNTTDPEVLFKLSLRVAMNELSKLKDYPDKLIQSTNDRTLQDALKVCATVFDDAVDRLNDSISSMAVGEGEQILSPAKMNDLKTWLSATITDQETCLDALQDLSTTKLFNQTLDQVKTAMENSTEFVSNSLAIVAKILGLLSDFKIPIHRRLLGFERSHVSEFPQWVRLGDRRLLQESNPTPNVTVAKDGTGDCKTLREAVEKIPKKSESRFVIHVKEGEYVENVILDKSKWNVMIYGEGKDKTIVSGSLNFVDGTPTFSTATFAVAGKGFFARDMKFINTAGAAKHQAVAFRSGSDMSVFYRCAFDAFQDTLYAHSNRQFYRECDITGTIDFIFGNAAVVFQNCNIQPRQPLTNQFNTITAQGKKDPNQNTGISIQKCKFSALDNVTAPTYLGRPWKDYSTTVIMQSDIGSFLKPSGWISWVSGVDPPATIFYAEYQNTGPGAIVDGRVTWDGYKPALTVDEAAKFAVDSFIQGTEWLSPTSVTFQSALSKLIV